MNNGRNLTVFCVKFFVVLTKNGVRSLPSLYTIAFEILSSKKIKKVTNPVMDRVSSLID